MRLFVAHRRQLFALVLSLVPSVDDADDLMQEVSGRLWEKFDEFEPGTNFVAWGKSFIRYAALDFNRKNRRSARRVTFDDALLTIIADRIVVSSVEVGAREHALQQCVKRLPDHSRKMIELRYTDGQSLKSVADRLGRPVQSVSKSLSRIRSVLADCVRRVLAGEDR